jgi:hypothetical protein
MRNLPCHSPSVNTDQLPPHDDTAEAGALACILAASNGEAESNLDRLTLDDFYDVRHQAIFRALRCLKIDGKPLGVVSVSQWLRDKGELQAAGGLEYLAALPDATPSAANFPTYQTAIQACRVRRAVIRDCLEGQKLAENPAISTKVLADAWRRMLEGLASFDVGNEDPWLKQISDAAAIMELEIPPVVEIVEGITTEHSKLGIGSSSKSNKTWLAMDLGLSIAHGVTFLGHQTARRRVLYVNPELKEATFERRIQAIAKAKGIAVEPTWFNHLALRGKLAGITLNGIVSRIIRIAGRLQVEVVVLDSIYKLNTEGAENDSRDQTLFYNEVDRLTTEGKCTVIMIDHAGKGNQSEKEPLDVFRGSSVKGGDLDAAMILRRHEVEGCFRVDLIHRELPPVEPFVIGWNFPLMEARPELSPEAMKKAKGGRKAAHDPREFLAAIVETTAENSVSISAWAASAGVKRPTLQTYLPEMRSAGWIQTAGQGSSARQYITEKGKEIARKHQGEEQ